MCIICSTFNPQVLECEYTALPPGVVAPAPGDTINEIGDAGNTTTTSGNMGVGEFFMGELSTTTDSDWIEITLEAGTYTIAGVGVGPLSNALNNITLTLRDANGNFVQSDDNDGPGRNADMTVTVTDTTTFYIDVNSAWSFDSGTYGVSVTEGERAAYNLEMGAGNLMRPNQAWVTTPGNEVNLTWAIRSTGNDPLNNSPGIAMNANQVALTIAAMAYTDAISGLNFTQVNPGGTSNNATMLFGAYQANDGSGAYAYYPGSNGGNTSFGANQGDVWLNNNSFHSGQSYGIGTYTSYTMLHEIGHAIGLAHPGDYNAAPGVSITYGNNAQFIQDSHQYTVMSYFGETNTGVSGGLGYPDTFMLYDFMAIHQLYGANLNYNAGNTIYGFNATEANSVYDFTFNTTPLMTVYDGGGTDTIDLSGYTMGQMLSLEAGVFSNIGGYTGNFSIAYGAMIENAIGGSGDDTMTGNEGDNLIEGGEGADSLDGFGGADTLIGGLGNDTLNGGNQFDSLEGGGGRDSMTGGMGNDTLLGGTQNDRMSGGNGNDSMLGQMGADTLIGGRGDDLLDGGNRRDKLIGGEGNDTLLGGRGDDLMRGGAQNDLLDGGLGNDSMVGGAGFDTLIGGVGNDTMTGNFNADVFIFRDNHGVDEITDFDATNDFEKIDFSGLSTVNSITDILGNGTDPGIAMQVGNDVLIDTGNGNSILLRDVLYSDLDALDFIF
ncbi:M10 family metallopeptidase C-terminal domain-containing protein [Gymnodinialimonas sp.]